MPNPLVTLFSSYLLEWRRHCDGLNPLTTSVPIKFDPRLSELAAGLEKDMAEGFKLAPLIVCLLARVASGAR